MSFVARAYKSHKRGDTLRGVFVLVTGLRRSPNHDEAIEALIDLYSKSANISGLEHEVIDVLNRRDDIEHLLPLIIYNLNESGNVEASKKMRALAEEQGLVFDDHIPEADPLEEKEDAVIVPIIEEDPQESTEVETKVEKDLFEIPDGIEYEPEAETLDLDRDKIHLEESSPLKIKKKKSSKFVILFLVFAGLVGSGVWVLKMRSPTCPNCVDFDQLITNWPTSQKSLEALSHDSPEIKERFVFLNYLTNPQKKSPELTSPVTWYGIAMNGINQNQLCAERYPAHIAIESCRLTFYLNHDDIENVEKVLASLKIEFPQFRTKKNTQNAHEKSYSKDDPIRNVFLTLFSDYNRAKGEGKILAKSLTHFPRPFEYKLNHLVSPLFDALQFIALGEFEKADRILISFLSTEPPLPVISLVQAIFPRAFLYSGKGKLAAKYSAPLGGKHLDGDDERPVQLKTNPINLAMDWWEAEEAIFSRAELLAELGYPTDAQTVLGQLKDIGVSFERTREMQEVISCLILAKCAGTKSNHGRSVARWLAGDVDVEMERSWTGIFKGIPGKTLDYRSNGALNRWWFQRMRLVAASMHGRQNLVLKEIENDFKAQGFSADLSRGLAKFWQGNYQGSIDTLESIELPIAKGFVGLANRALGEGAKGNKQLRDAGLRFDKQGGADFELGILNQRLGNIERANHYFWSAWTQDWSKENAIILWCETLKVTDYAKARRRLRSLDDAEMEEPLRQRLLSIREMCLVALTQVRKNGHIKNLPDRNTLGGLSYWVLRKHGEFAYSREDYSNARIYFDHAMNLNPTDSEILYGAGRCAQKDHDLVVAKRLAKRYLSLWPKGSHIKWAKDL